MEIREFEIILYCRDQQRSSRFYEVLLQQTPDLEVPGMTEFVLSEHLKLGLMPEQGIARIIHPALPHPEDGNGIPRCELYLVVGQPEAAIERALASGATLISPLSARDWGDEAAYLADPDGHVVALARRPGKSG